VEVAKSIAADIREYGKIKRKKDSVNDKIIRNANWDAKRIPGTLKKVRAIGWHIREYGIAQVSMNLTDIEITPLHRAFVEVCDKARLNGVQVTGSELIGLVPLQAMLDAGTYFLRKGHHSMHIPEKEIINAAIKSLGLDELAPFDPNKKILEYLLEQK
jgi:glutamate formiminotransferase/formiminotetrahydrofolate cyclodeaminase